jgi:hypothetical protein
VSEAGLRRLSELALIGIASVWGLTFVMVKDALHSRFVAVEIIPRFRPPRPLPEG